jgi:phosphate transport system permease protein
MVVVVKLLSIISPSGSGYGMLACIIILSMMILPTVTSISKNAIEAVPEEFYLGALALGATKEQAMFRVEIPAAKSGITAALLLGIGRAVGETMAIIMVAGNRAIMPTGLFSNIRTLTINMVMEMAYATDLHKQALIATGVVLMVFIILLNLLVSFYRRDRSHIKKTLFKRRMRSISFHPYDIDIDTPRRQGQLETILKYLAMVFCIMSLTSLVIIVVFIFIKGMGHISLDLLFGVSGNAGMTLRPAFISTIMLISLALTLALPIGIGAAIYLVEYSKRQNKIIKLVRLATEVLSGVPSIVFGLFGMIFFCEILGFGYSLLAGGLTLALTILPTIIRATEESLLAVKNSLREGSYALGARKAQTIFKVIIPVSIPGIITAIILSIGRMVGESAALIFTSGAVAYTPSFYDQPGSSFAVMMWMFSNEGLYINAAYATAAVLMIIVIVINISIAVLDSKLKKRRSQ